MECRIGLTCDWETCPNQRTCQIWGQPWPLPYYYDPEEDGLIIDCKNAFKETCLSFFEDLCPSLRQTWKEAGFADAEFLPYSGSPGKLWVNWEVPGFAPAIPLPYLRRVEDGVPMLLVRHCLRRDAKKAGYCPAIPLDIDNLPF